MSCTAEARGCQWWRDLTLHWQCCIWTSHIPRRSGPTAVTETLCRAHKYSKTLELRQALHLAAPTCSYSRLEQVVGCVLVSQALHHMGGLSPAR